MVWEKEGFAISDDPGRLDLDVICQLLSGSYWGQKRTRDVIERSIRHSIPLGLYHGQTQIGFARLVTDRSTFTWLAECAACHPEIGTGIQMLRTRDAHGVYEKLGFSRAQCMIRWPAGHEPMPWSTDKRADGA